MMGGGPLGLDAGHWTDDTSMALCLAESLIVKRDFDPVDQMERYLKWLREGHLSSLPYSFGIGRTVRFALQEFEQTGEPYSGPTDYFSAGNGCIMRLAPVPMFYALRPKEAIEKSALSGRTTHGAEVALDACRYFGAMLVGALSGASKEELLSELYCPIPGYWERNPLEAEIYAIATGFYKNRKPPQIRGTGYVVQSLEAAIWCFYQTHSFRDGCLMAVNLGDDADTTAAVYGQLAGAFYGEEEIPDSWRRKLARRELIESYAEQLHSTRQNVFHKAL
jgi:ADP-ribosylglycohydrolase